MNANTKKILGITLIGGALLFLIFRKKNAPPAYPGNAPKAHSPEWYVWAQKALAYYKLIEQGLQPGGDLDKIRSQIKNIVDLWNQNTGGRDVLGDSGDASGVAGLRRNRV